MAVLKISKRLWICSGILALMVLAGGAVLAVRKAHTGPLHCQSCHADRTKQWKSSGPHSTETTCTDCHAPNGGLTPKTANVFGYYRDIVLPTHVKASAQIMNANCLACHAAVLDGSTVTSGTVLMNHRVHWGEGMTCIDCHRNISHDQMAGGTYRPTKKTCYECHLRDIDAGSSQDRSCANCHRTILSRDGQNVNERF